MAARSTGLFPREGFNFDAECEITTTPTPAKTNLAHAKTIRVVATEVNIPAPDREFLAVYLRSDRPESPESVIIFTGDMINDAGIGIAHFRGAILEGGDNIVYYELPTTADEANPPSVGKVFYELVDGPQR